MHLVEAIAAESGLRYVYTNERRAIACHHCGGVLVGNIGWVNCDLHVTPDAHCDHCGGAVPIIGISRAEYEAVQAEDAIEYATDVKARPNDNMWASMPAGA